MNLIESYALACGVKIGKPFIYEKFFPNTLEKYITFHPFSKPAKSYDYWNEVLAILFPILNREEIRILQIGGPNEPVFNGCVNVVGMTTPNQVAFLLKDALLHLGADSFPVHVASHYDKKIVALYSNNYINCVKPYFGSNSNKILLEPDRKGKKPKFVLDENPKSINDITPESIANAVLKLLNLTPLSNRKTVNIGNYYNRPSFEMIPVEVVDLNKFGLSNIIVRMDLEFNQVILNEQLKSSKCLIMTDKALDPNMLLNHKKNIERIFYKVTKDVQVGFVDFLQKNNFEHQLITELSNEELNPVKISLFDYDQIVDFRSRSKQELNITSTDNLYYRSSKRIIYKNQVFSSVAAIKANAPLIQETNKVIDNEDFWKESEHFYLFEE